MRHDDSAEDAHDDRQGAGREGGGDPAEGCGVPVGRHQPELVDEREADEGDETHLPQELIGHIARIHAIGRHQKRTIRIITDNKASEIALDSSAFRSGNTSGDSN